MGTLSITHDICIRNTSCLEVTVPDSALQEIVCCMGQPVAGNPTQFMMQRAFHAAGLDWCYLTLEVAPDNLADAVRGLRAMGFRGANITIPHQIAVVPMLDSLSQSAEMMGAVNCIWQQDGRLIGDNTDGRAFLESLAGILDPRDKRVFLLGAGGAARAIAVELGLAGAQKITIANRTPDRANELVELLSSKIATSADSIDWQDNLPIPEDTDLLVNATSIGHLEYDAPIPLELGTLSDETVVADVVFSPPHTWLLEEAERRGCTVVNGLGMLVNQTRICFQVWTEREPDPQIMLEAVEEYLEI